MYTPKTPQIFVKKSVVIFFNRTCSSVRLKKLKSFEDIPGRVRPRFFDQVGLETTYASSKNKYFFTKSCDRQTYQNYEQSWQKLGTILGNKVP